MTTDTQKTTGALNRIESLLGVGTWRVLRNPLADNPSVRVPSGWQYTREIMGKAISTLTKQLKAAIKACGETLYGVAKGSGVAPDVVSRFMSEEPEEGRTGDIRLGTADKLAEYLDLELTKRKKSKLPSTHNQPRGKHGTRTSNHTGRR